MAQRDKNRTLDHNTTRTEAQAARRGKFSITGETVSLTDIPSSEVLDEWETVNDKAVTYRRGTEPQAPVTPDPDPEEPAGE